MYIGPDGAVLKLASLTMTFIPADSKLGSGEVHASVHSEFRLVYFYVCQPYIQSASVLFRLHLKCTILVFQHTFPIKSEKGSPPERQDLLL